MWNQETYLTALNFAARAHQGQKVPGAEIPYVVHLCQVAMEVMATPETKDLALNCALLHDTLEDTKTSYEEVRQIFGAAVADGVQALTKNDSLPKCEQMADSLARIRQQPHEVWMVKLADRITNLQKPPEYWKREKRIAYQTEAKAILAELGEANQALAQRLQTKIESYAHHIDPA